MKLTSGPGEFSRQTTDENGNKLFDGDTPIMETITFGEEYVLLQDDCSSILLDKNTLVVKEENGKYQIYYNGQKHYKTYSECIRD